jgi:stage V sporulation protein B
LVYFLVPIYGIYGYIATIYIAEIINAALSIFRMIKVTGLRPPIIKFLLCPLACTAGAASICNILGKTVASPNSVAGLVFGIILYVLIYMLAMFCIGGFSKDDVFWIKSIFSKK